MKTAIRSLIMIVVVAVVAPVAFAQEFHRNAYGMYAAPVIYGFAEGTRYQLGSSGGGLDLGIYYAHAFNAGFSARIEAKYARRDLDDAEVSAELVPADPYIAFVLSETMIQVPLIIQADRRIVMNDHELRVSVGGGPSFTFVTDQKLLTPDDELSNVYELTPSDSYQRFGLVADGGATLGVNRKSAVFMRFRFDTDVSTMGADDNTAIVRRLWAAGFYAGFEYGF